MHPPCGRTEKMIYCVHKACLCGCSTKGNVDSSFSRSSLRTGRAATGKWFGAVVGSGIVVRRLHWGRSKGPSSEATP